MVPIPFQEILDNYEEWKRYYEGFPGHSLLPPKKRMVTTEKGPQAVYTYPVLVVKKRCVHYDDHKRKCKIYENRPKPCRDYMCPEALKQ